ncbi:fasciclin domain-containing protein [Paraflavisolibacter sp. H34]|uniref:fasciclin domain-containing protein n=1 Tax=Huijunlia imazamoxiresistens TaxID=3127457 RepID=UPI00301A693B
MKKYIFIILASASALLAAFAGCKKTELRETTTSDVNLLEYLQQDSLQRFSSLLSVIQKAGYESALNVYGTYTLFAPTNAAFDAYLKQTGKTSLDQFTSAELQELLKFHLLEEQIRTSDFNDGKLPSVTMQGQFLVTGITNSNGTSSFQVNRQAAITQPNVVLGNGILQVIDHVLTPSRSSLANLLELDPEYSIFLQAVKETGYYDQLNDTAGGKNRKWYTLLAQTNQSLRDSGFASYDALKARYSKGDPKSTTDSLNIFVAYHILPDVKYLADIVMAGSHETLVPLEVVTSKQDSIKRVLVNDDEYTTGMNEKIHETGFELEQSTSDVSAINGVLHRVKGVLQPKVRAPYAVYWDLCAEVPELTRLSAVYRKKTFLFDYNDGNAFKDIKWEKSCLRYKTGVNGVYGDYWQMGMGTSGSVFEGGSCEGNSWIEFNTPLLVKGKYKVWFCYYVQNSTQSAVQASFDGVPLTSALIQFHQKIAKVTPVETSAPEMEALGWKWWGSESLRSGSTSGRMLGIVDVKATGRHKIRFDLVSGKNGDCNFDMIHFIPVGMNQLNPRFNKDGSKEYRNY